MSFHAPGLTVIRSGHYLGFNIPNATTKLDRQATSELRNCLTEFLGDAPPSVADDKVEAVIQAAREWSERFTNRDTRYLNAPSKQLYEAIRALDPPEDPDKALVEKIVENTLALDSGSEEFIREAIRITRQHDVKR